MTSKYFTIELHPSVIQYLGIDYTQVNTFLYRMLHTCWFSDFVDIDFIFKSYATNFIKYKFYYLLLNEIY